MELINKIPFIKSKDVENDLKLAPSFAEAHVTLRQHIADNIYLMSNGDLAVCYEVPGLYDEPLTQSEFERQIFPYEKFLRRCAVGFPYKEMPGNTIIQFICRQRLVENEPENGSKLRESRAKGLLKAEQSFYFSHGLAERKQFITVRLEAKKKKFWQKKENIFDRVHEFHKELRNVEIESGFEDTSRRLAPDEVIALFNNSLNGGIEPNYTLEEPESFISLHQNIVNPEMQATPDSLKVMDKDIKTFTLNEYPTYYAIGQFKHFLANLPFFSWDLVTTLSSGAVEAGGMFKLKELWYAKGPAYKQIYDDLVSARNAMGAQSPLMKSSVRLVTYGISEEMENRITSASIEHIRDVTINKETQINSNIFASTLPMNCTTGLNEIIGRHRDILVNKAMAFMPLYAGPRKDNRAARFWRSRLDTVTSFDLFGASDNQAICALGVSGGGKSCLVAQLILEFLARYPEGVIRVIDKRTSYGKTCDLFGGKVVNFSAEKLKNEPYSPFALEHWDEDSITQVKTLILSAITQLNRDAKIQGGHEEVLAHAIKTRVSIQQDNLEEIRNGNNQLDIHFTWTDILQTLFDSATELGLERRFANDLKEWGVSLEEGKNYGFVFCSQQKEFNSDSSQLLVFDLSGIEDQFLQNISAQIAFTKLSSDLSRLPAKTPKLIIFEELGVLLEGDTEQSQELANKMVKNIVKTSRKLGAIPLGITNEVEDFFSKPGGKSFWKQATQKIFLPFSDAMVSALEGEKDFNEADVEIIASLRKNKAQKYSTAYIKSNTNHYFGTIKIPLSPLMNALITTDARELSLYDELRKKGISTEKALFEMATKHPYGEGL